MYDQFHRDLLDGQKKANRTNTGVQVSLRNQSTFVEPNLPKFTKKEIDKRFSAMMSVELEDLDQPESQSILARTRAKMSTNRSM